MLKQIKNERVEIDATSLYQVEVLFGFATLVYVPS